MVAEVIQTIQGLDQAQEHQLLAEHLAVTSPLALESLARRRQVFPEQHAQHLAAIQLRVISELASRLMWLESVSLDPSVEPALRVAIAGLLHGLSAEPDALRHPLSPSLALLEPAALFHALVSRLRPWLPPIVVALEPEPVVDILRLGIPDYLHPLLVQRFELLWARFHELRALPSAGEIANAEGTEIDDAGLSHAIESAAALNPASPPPPPWTTPSWISPWLDAGPPTRPSRQAAHP